MISKNMVRNGRGGGGGGGGRILYVPFLIMSPVKNLSTC